MASRGRRGPRSRTFFGARTRGQGDGPGPSGHRDGWSQPDERTAPEPGGWSGPDDFAEADPGPETGHWQFDPEDDRDGDGTAAWDGPMAWEDDQQGATWVEDGGGQGGGTWEQDVPPTTYSTWEADRSRPSPYGYESSYPTAYMRPGEAPGAYTDYEAPDRSRRGRVTAVAAAGSGTVGPMGLAGTGHDHCRRRHRRRGGPGCDQRRPHEPGQVAFFVEHACPRHRLSHNKHDSSPHLLGPALEVVNSATPNHDGAASHDHCGRGRKGAEPPGYGGRGKLPHPLVARHQPGRRRPGLEGCCRDTARRGLLRRPAGVGHLLGAGRVQAFSHVARGIFDGGRAGEAGRVPEQRLCLLLEVGTGLDAPGRSQRRQLPGGRPCAGP